MNARIQNDLDAGSKDDIGLWDLIHILWSAKWIIVAATFVGAIVSIVAALMMPDVYRAEALLAPNDQKSGGGLAALAARYGGLASLAGIDISGGSTDKTALGLETLKSRKFISEFIDRHDILVPLMAASDWDAETGELVINAKIYDIASKSWVRTVAPPLKSKPSSQEGYKQFTRSVLSVSQDPKTGFVRVAVQHYSPVVAKTWVEWLVRDLNTAIMSQEVGEAKLAIEYLERQVAATPLADLRSVFYSLIEEQTKTVMLASVTEEFLLKTIDPAVVPERKTKPLRAVIVISSTTLATFLSMLLVLGNASRRRYF